MQKKIIALAVAGLASTAAFAQSNVQIYGVADAFVGYLHTSTALSRSADSVLVGSGGMSGSRLGFKGTEDLGNGLKAMFLLEQGFNIDNGTNLDAGSTAGAAGTATASSAFNRQSFVGLSSKAGDLTLGRQYAPGYGYSIAYDALAATAFSPLQQGQGFMAATAASTGNARWNNSIKYVTPNMGGVQVQAVYRAGEQANEIAQNEGWAVGVEYKGGPIGVAYAYHHTESSANGGAAITKPTAQVPGTTAAQDEHFIGFSFDAKVVIIRASYQMSDWGNRLAAGDGNFGQLYNLGVIVPVGKGNIHVGGALGDRDGNPGAGGGRADFKQAALAYTHGLSKRTTLYTGVSYSDRSGAGVTLATVGADNGVYGAGAAQAGQQATLFAAGINHQF
jgi:predicted porin